MMPEDTPKSELDEAPNKDDADEAPNIGAAEVSWALPERVGIAPPPNRDALVLAAADTVDPPNREEGAGAADD